VQEFISFTVSGLTSAAIYAIVASGLVLTYTTTGTFNFAQGAMAMVGAFAYWQFHVDWGWPVPVALAVSILVVAPVLGLLVARLMRGIETTSETVRIVATLGLLLGLLGAVQYIWDPVAPRTLPTFFEGHALSFLGTRVTWHQLITIAVAVLVAAGLWFLLHRTRTGVAMRAAVDDATLATLAGARPVRSAATAWIIGSVLAAVSGILVAPTIKLNAIQLSLLIVNAYGAAAFGRLRSLPMAFAGALLLGLTRDYSIWLRSDAPHSIAPYVQGLSSAMPAIVLFVILVALPAAPLRPGSARSRELTPRQGWRGTAALCLACVAVTGLFAATSGPAQVLSAGRIWGYAIIGLSMVPLIGLGGQISLAQLSFAGIGGVAYAHIGLHNPMGLVWAGACAALAGILIALPAIRLAGIYLALATGAFAVALELWLFQLPRFSVLGHRFELFSGGTLPVRRPSVPGVDLRGDGAYFIYSAVVFAALVVVVVLIRRGRLGQQLIAMKDAPAAIATIGIDNRRLRLIAFGVSAAIAGVGGAILAGAQQSVSQDSFGLFAGLSILLLMVVAGIAHPGAAVFTGFMLGGTEILGQLPLGPLAPLAQGGGIVQTLAIGSVAVFLARNPNGFIAEALDAGRRRKRGQAEPPDIVPELIGLDGPSTPREVFALDRRIGLGQVTGRA
jgi:branched-chain amino acid transport system permease protein